MDIIFDIDGTIADLTHRRHFVASKPKNWDAFFAGIADDKPITPVISVLNCLFAKNFIILCTGRGEEYREQTVQWLDRHGVEYDALYMRPAGDYRPDDIIKEELLDQMIAEGHKPQLVFDDRKRVVDMWRRRGIICAQVAEGDF